MAIYDPQYDTQSLYDKMKTYGVSTPALATGSFSTGAYVPSLTPGEQVAKAGKSFGGTAKLFGDPLVQSSLQNLRAQKKALSGQDFSPQQLQGIAAGEVGAYLKQQLEARDQALREYQLKEQTKQFGANLGQRQAEFGFEQEKFGKTFGLSEKEFEFGKEKFEKTFGLEERKFQEYQSQWKQDYDLRYKTWETSSQLDRDKFENNKYQFEQTYKFNYEQFLELKRQFDEKHALDEETMQLKKDELDKQDWQNLAKFALQSPLLYAEMARSLWGSTNPWLDLKEKAGSAYDYIKEKFFGGDDSITHEPWTDADQSRFDDLWRQENFGADYEPPPGDFGLDFFNSGGADYEPPTGGFDDYSIGGDISSLGLDLASQGGQTALDLASSYGGDYGIGGALDSVGGAAGSSLPYLGLAKTAYNVATQGPNALVSPSTIGLAASGASYLSGLGAMASTGVGAIPAAAAAGMVAFGKANFGGTGMTMAPFAKDNRGLLISGAGGSVPQQFIDMIDTDMLLERFKTQNGFDASIIAGNDPRIKGVLEWVDRQPEVRQAQQAYNKWSSDNRLNEVFGY